jgi:uncharacterized protein (DUF433 family)
MAEILSAFTADQAATLTGLSPGQLAAWDRDGFFEPSLAYEKRRSPYSRIYTFEDVVGLRTLAILRKKVSLQHLKKAAKKLREHSGRPWTELTLYVLNREVHFRRPDSKSVEGAVSGQMAIEIPLETVADDVRERADSLRHRSEQTVGQISQKKFVMGGVPTIAGTRITVANVQAFADAGYSVKQILEQYPQLKKQDIEAALAQKRFSSAA